MSEEPILDRENRDRDPLTGRFLDGNPGGPGRPVGFRSMLSAINRRMDKLGPDGKTTSFETTADNITQKILDGQDGWDKLYTAYLDGQPKATTVVEGNPELPVTIKVIEDESGTDS